MIFTVPTHFCSKQILLLKISICISISRINSCQDCSPPSIAKREVHRLGVVALPYYGMFPCTKLASHALQPGYRAETKADTTRTTHRPHAPNASQTKGLREFPHPTRKVLATSVR